MLLAARGGHAGIRDAESDGHDTIIRRARPGAGQVLSAAGAHRARTIDRARAPRPGGKAQV